MLKSIRKMVVPVSSARVVFPHVPKCGGNSIINAVNNASKRGRSRIRVDYLNAAVCDKMSEGGVRRWLQCSQTIFSYLSISSSANLIVGHAPFPEESVHLLSKDTCYVTILREPVERWISNFIYDKFKVDGPGKHDLPIEAYLDSEKGKASGEYYARFFSADCDSDKSESNAVENLLSFHALGFLDNLNPFFSQLGSILQLDLKPSHQNLSPKSEMAGAIRKNRAIVARIKDLCSLDLNIYERVRKERFPDA